MGSFRDLNMMFQQRQPVMQQAMTPAQRGPNAGVRRPGMIGAQPGMGPGMGNRIPPQAGGMPGGLARYGYNMANPGFDMGGGMGLASRNDIPPVGFNNLRPIAMF